jgi:hypothetical protein
MQPRHTRKPVVTLVWTRPTSLERGSRCNGSCSATLPLDFQEIRRLSTVDEDEEEGTTHTHTHV